MELIGILKVRHYRWKDLDIFQAISLPEHVFCQADEERTSKIHIYHLEMSF